MVSYTCMNVFIINKSSCLHRKYSSNSSVTCWSGKLLTGFTCPDFLVSLPGQTDHLSTPDTPWNFTAVPRHLTLCSDLMEVWSDYTKSTHALINVILCVRSSWLIQLLIPTCDLGCPGIGRVLQGLQSYDRNFTVYQMEIQVFYYLVTTSD